MYFNRSLQQLIHSVKFGSLIVKETNLSTDICIEKSNHAMLNFDSTLFIQWIFMVINCGIVHVHITESKVI